MEVLRIDNGCVNLASNQVIKAFNYINCIKVLSLNNLGMSRDIVNELASAIKLCTCLESIYLHGNNLKLSVIMLSEALQHLKYLAYKVMNLQKKLVAHWHL